MVKKTDSSVDDSASSVVEQAANAAGGDFRYATVNALELIRAAAGPDDRAHLEMILSLLKAIQGRVHVAEFDYAFACHVAEDLLSRCFADDRAGAVEIYLRLADLLVSAKHPSGLTRYILSQAFAHTNMIYPLVMQTMDRIDALDRRLGYCEISSNADARLLDLCMEYANPAISRLEHARETLFAKKSDATQKRNDCRKVRDIIAPLAYMALDAQESEKLALLKAVLPIVERAESSLHVSLHW